MLSIHHADKKCFPYIADVAIRAEGLKKIGVVDIEFILLSKVFEPLGIIDDVICAFSKVFYILPIFRYLVKLILL